MDIHWLQISFQGRFWFDFCPFSQFPTSYPIPVKDLLELGFCLLIHALSRLLSSINYQRRWKRMTLLWCDDCLPSILVDTDVAQGFFAREGKVGPCVHQFGAQIASPGRWPFLLWKTDPAARSSFEVTVETALAFPVWRNLPITTVASVTLQG